MLKIGKTHLLCVCILGLAWLSITINAVKITDLQVPKTAWEPVILNCRYDLESGVLYAVKWYKDEQEFLRCQGNGSVLTFELKEIKTYYTDQSIGSCFFELTALTAQSGGVYKCEVSLDWPTFEIVSQSATLRIVEPSKFIQSEPAKGSNNNHNKTTETKAFIPETEETTVLLNNNNNNGVTSRTSVWALAITIWLTYVAL